MPKRKKATLSEQIAELSNPKPVSYNPDDEELEQDTAARVCDFTYEDEVTEISSTRVLRSRDPLESDPRYVGRKISRREIGKGFDAADSLLSDTASGLDDDDVMSDVMSDVQSEDEVHDDQSEDGTFNSDQSGEERDDDKAAVPVKFLAFSDQSEDEEAAVPIKFPEFSDQSEEEAAFPAKFPAFSVENLKEDIEKGKAAKQQLKLWERLLETRIRLQKVLLLGNRMPQCDTLLHFQAAGDQQVAMAIRESQSVMRKLLQDLLALQRMLLLKNKDTRKLVGMETTNQDADFDDEEVPSDFEEDGDDGDKNSMAGGDAKNSSQSENCTLPAAILELEEFEHHLASAHQCFKSYQDEVIERWNTKTQLASGKLNSKAFVRVDQSVLGQIKHVLRDRPRLIKRTQLKRSVYTTLGKRKQDDSEVGGASGGQTDQSNHRDAHLKDYDEEIFDDDDFYHQLLRELIERRINYTESSDPVAMGRQWLQLQKLRTKVKKNVDTKASKGRKIRYTVHPKLVNFMAPVEQGTMSDVSRNDLFASLFGKNRQL